MMRWMWELAMASMVGMCGATKAVGGNVAREVVSALGLVGDQSAYEAKAESAYVLLVLVPGAWWLEALNVRSSDLVGDGVGQSLGGTADRGIFVGLDLSTVNHVGADKVVVLSTPECVVHQHPKVPVGA